MLTTLAIANYRSIQDLTIALGQLNVITGANGSGKSNVYRSLRLLAEAAQGRIVSALAREGGLGSVLWAGGQKRGHNDPVNLQLGFASEHLGYMIDLGIPVISDSMFSRDPEIKTENIWAGPFLRAASTLVKRNNALVQARNDGGEWQILSKGLNSYDSMLTQLADPRNAPEMFALREQVRSWRFYDHFRSDADAPARQPQVGTRTPVLADDGRDMGAAAQTIREIGDWGALCAAVDDAFPGARLELGGNFELLMHIDGLRRPLSASEWSDGTLRYMLWVVALLSPRPPELLVLNEPETSLHPDLLPALGRLISAAAERSQVIVVSHASRLISTLAKSDECQEFCLDKVDGATQVLGLSELDRPAWQWGKR